MTLPAFIFGMLIAAFYGSVFHLIFNGGLIRLLLFLVLSVIGFWAGQLVADLLGWKFLMVGPLALGVASPGSLLFLILGLWLGMINRPE